MPATQQIDIPGVGLVEFPDSMSDGDIAAAAKKLHDSATVPDAIEPQKPGTTSGLTLAALSKMTPAAANEALRFATSPTAAKTGGALARGATTLGAVGHGLATRNVSEVLAAPMAGWAAGKGGYFLTQGMQAMAKPVASALEKVAPYAEKVAAIAGPQGVLDLAQMAEPNRKDIGFLGVGPSVNIPPQQAKAITDQSYVDAVKWWGTQGKNPSQAAALIAKGDPKIFGAVMTAYMQARQVK